MHESGIPSSMNVTVRFGSVLKQRFRFMRFGFSGGSFGSVRGSCRLLKSGSAAGPFCGRGRGPPELGRPATAADPPPRRGGPADARDAPPAGSPARTRKLEISW